MEQLLSKSTAHIFLSARQ